MKRTIRMKCQDVYYGGRPISWLRASIRKYFKLKDSDVFKYVITIVEGTQFRFVNYYTRDYQLKTATGKVVGTICKWYFDKLFFAPDCDKKYDITVKKVRI